MDVENVSRSDGTGAEVIGRHYKCRPSLGLENDDVRSKGSDHDHVGHHYKWCPSGGAVDVVENNGEKVTGSEKNNSENVSRLHNWPVRRDTLNDGVENVNRSKVNLHRCASACGKQRDRKDTSTGHNEVTDNDSQDSDSNYQTSIDDSDVEDTRTRDKRTATYHATSQSDFEILQMGNNSPTRDTPELHNQVSRPIEMGIEITSPINLVKCKMHSVLYCTNQKGVLIGGGVKPGPRNVTVNSTRENS